jgi:hypothetical protein
MLTVLVRSSPTVLYPTYMNRRTFLGLSAATGLIRTSFAAPAPVNKRERMFGWLAGQSSPSYTPAAFFLHFGNDYKAGSAAAKRHLEFFRFTDMDFVKIQFEQTYSRQQLGAGSCWSLTHMRLSLPSSH